MVVGADAVDLDKILPEEKKVVEADSGEDVVAAEETFIILKRMSLLFTSSKMFVYNYYGLLYNWHKIKYISARFLG